MIQVKCGSTDLNWNTAVDFCLSLLRQSHMSTHWQNNHHGKCTRAQSAQKRKLHRCTAFDCGGGLLPFCISRLQPNSNTQPAFKWKPSSFHKCGTQQLQHNPDSVQQQEKMSLTVVTSNDGQFCLTHVSDCMHVCMTVFDHGKKYSLTAVCLSLSMWIDFVNRKLSQPQKMYSWTCECV